MAKPHFRQEKSLLASGLWPIAGVDEAGRGPLAGPVTAAAVVLDPKKLPKGLDDSKKLTGIACVEEIDRINIRNATFLAMTRAIHALALPPVHVLIDGNARPKNLPCAAQTIIKGDGISVSIAAASIIAKVTRDRLMQQLDQSHPGYGFGEHMGYSTPAHFAALKSLGPCSAHRRSFAPVRAQVEPELPLLDMVSQG